MNDLAPLIHVVDDDVDLQTAVTRLLRAAGYDVRCYASAGEFFVAPFDGRPGCLLLDVRMPGPGGLEIQEALVRMAWQLPIVFMSGYADTQTTVRAIKAGAVDFLTKPVDEEILLSAVSQALDRAREFRASRAERNTARAMLESLTQRETEVMHCVITGMLNKQTAARLGIAEKTVKIHRGRMMRKTRCISVPELMRLLHKAGDPTPLTSPQAVR